MKTRIVCSSSIALPGRHDLSIFTLETSDSLFATSAFVLTLEDAKSSAVTDVVAQWGTPLFVVLNESEMHALNDFIPHEAIALQAPLLPTDVAQVRAAAESFNLASLPPFTRTVAEFVSRQRPTFACPGHQGGRCLDLHPTGTRFKELLGTSIFQIDVPHASPELGDILCHEGPVREAEDLAAQVFNADETYFVLNGTSTANKIVTSALLTAGDLVLMDRNNHKSVYLGALIQSGASPVYLDNFRDAFGILGGYRRGALDECALRQRVAAVSEPKSRRERPFRLAIIQHATCDGVVLDAAALVKKIGHLCDYILFDSAWSGYEPFVSQLSHLSPLNIPVTEDSPGLIVTQSVHKQMSGLSQTSQIHKKDKHIKHTPRHCSRNVFNSAFMLHSSTSPFYPLFMSLEVNAAIHADGHGQRLWSSAASVAATFRSLVASRCRFITPYYGKQVLQSSDSACPTALPYTPYESLEILCELSADSEAIEPDLHYLDPCKVIFTTKCREGSATSERYRIPAGVITTYLRENNFTPEKSDFYNFTLLISPSSDISVLTRLANCLEKFELLLAEGTPALEALPSLAASASRYKGLSLRALCDELSSLYSSHNVEKLQSDIFSSISTSRAKYTPFEANQRFIRGDSTLVKVVDAVDRIAAEAIIPYPPGVVCIAPGEQWNHALVAYLVTIETLMNSYPEFSPHIQGVHEIQNHDGSVSLGVLTLG